MTFKTSHFDRREQQGSKLMVTFNCKNSIIIIIIIIIFLSLFIIFY